MTYLIDANIWLQLILDRDRADEVKQFLVGVPSRFLCVTDFAVFSVAITLERKERFERFQGFLQESLLDAQTHLVRLTPADLISLLNKRHDFNLDFDDAYQYVAAERHDLTIVSFDADFDKTARGRIKPAEALRRYRQESGTP